MLSHDMKFAVLQALLNRNSVLRTEDRPNYQSLGNGYGQGFGHGATVKLDDVIAEAEKICAYIEGTKPKATRKR